MTGDFEVLGPVKIRPADLYVIEGHRQAGIVVIGDAFATSCPAEGMAVEKNADFYDDRIKTASDAWSTAKAYHLKSLTLDNSPYWRAQRWTRFLVRLTQAASHAAPTHQRPPWGHTARS